jgi:zinc protease
VGVRACDLLEQKEIEVRGKVVVNAAGPWAKWLLDEGAHLTLKREPTFSRDPGLNRDPGLLDIYTRIKDPAKIDAVLAAIDATTEQFRETLVESADLDALKSRLRYGFLMGLETPDAVARGLARIVSISGGLEGIEALYSAYATISPEDIRAAAERYFDPNRRTIGVLRAEP